jgi:hypothetical protein
VNRHVRLYRRLVRLYPARFREHYADEMTTLFADQLRDARASPSRLAVVRLWVRSAADLVTTAPGEHFAAERVMPQTVDPASVVVEPDRTPHRLGVALAASPILVWALWAILIPGFTDPLYQNPPGIFGLPAGMVIMAVVAVLTILGLLVALRARSGRIVALALLLFTAPAIVLLTFAPSSVVIVQNLIA